MQFFCEHCGQPFTITAKMLGRRARCPHCQGDVQLPQAAEETADEKCAAQRPVHWLAGSVSGLISVVIHAVLFLVLALVSYGGRGTEGDTTEVLIGSLPSEQLSTLQEEPLRADEVPQEMPQPANELNEMLEVESPAVATKETAADDLALATPSPSSGETGAFDLGAVSAGGGSMAGGNWDGMIQSLRRNGLDIVITFDSTGSMSGEITEVKRQIARIGSTLVKLVPKARLSICTYRDLGDDYVVKGLPLSGDIQAVDGYLGEIRAGGGGDHPEAVHEGLRWAIQKNQFRPQARKVILLFGDAPPHPEHLQTCLRLAADFNSQHKGVVSTVTCREGVRLPEFVDIAYAGGGEAFLTTDERQIMTQLLVLVFGSQYRNKVLEAFKLLDR